MSLARQNRDYFRNFLSLFLLISGDSAVLCLVKIRFNWTGVAQTFLVALLVVLCLDDIQRLL